ncbi:MAG: major capsid protein P2, partial [Pseudomonadota bacterium]
VPGQTATRSLPLGLTYHALYVQMKYDNAGTPTDIPAANWATYVGEVRLIVNGEVKWRIDAADLISLAKFYGRDVKDGILPLYLARPWQRTVNGEDALAWGTESGVQSLVIELDLESGYTLSSISIRSRKSRPRAFGEHLVIRKMHKNIGSTGEHEISDLPIGDSGGRYRLIGAHWKTAGIDKWKVIVNSQEFRDQDRAYAEQVNEEHGLVHQANFTHVLMADRARLDDALPMNLQDFRFRGEFSATGNFAYYTEEVRPANVA